MGKNEKLKQDPGAENRLAVTATLSKEINLTFYPALFKFM